MIHLRKPSIQAVRLFLAIQSELSLNYAAVGATASQPPDGFAVDHTRICLGEGECVFRAAQLAFANWEQFRLTWVELWSPDTPLRPGEIVSVLARVGGIWWLNACRIVYTFDEKGASHRYGFAYGTLSGHVESGEERFMIEWDHETDQVWYDIYAFSRPKHILAKLGYPLTRRTQKRFRDDSIVAMMSYVHS